MPETNLSFAASDPKRLLEPVDLFAGPVVLGLCRLDAPQRVVELDDDEQALRAFISERVLR